MAIVMYEPATFKKEPSAANGSQPDHTIHEFGELLSIFPAR